MKPVRPSLWFSKIKRGGALVTLTLGLAWPAQGAGLDLIGQWPGWQRGASYGVAVNGNYAYVAAFDLGLVVIDVSNPAHPQWVGACDTSGYAQRVAVYGDYAYVADYTAGLQVIDVSDPANPQRVGGYNTSGVAWDVAVSGN